MAIAGERHSVAVIGAGAVGSYYGARLAQAGHDVRFLMRRDYDAVRANGLRILSVDGDFTPDRPTVVRSSEQIGPVDWVLCALKATSIEAAPELVGPCVGARTRILALMNGLGVEERFAGWLRQIFTVTLPLVKPAVAIGFVLVFSDILREVGASILLYSHGNEVVAYMLFNLWEDGQYQLMSSFIMITTLITLGMVALILRLSGQRFVHLTRAELREG